MLRIIHSPTPTDAVDVQGVLGVDNITLVRPAQVPIPGTLSLVAAGLALLVRSTRTRRACDETRR